MLKGGTLYFEPKHNPHNVFIVEILGQVAVLIAKPEAFIYWFVLSLLCLHWPSLLLLDSLHKEITNEKIPKGKESPQGQEIPYDSIKKNNKIWNAPYVKQAKQIYQHWKVENFSAW